MVTLDPGGTATLVMIWTTPGNTGMQLAAMVGAAVVGVTASASAISGPAPRAARVKVSVRIGSSVWDPHAVADRTISPSKRPSKYLKARFWRPWRGVGRPHTANRNAAPSR